MRKERVMHIFAEKPCARPPIRFRQKGNIDRKMFMGAALIRCSCKNIKDDIWIINYERGKHGREEEKEFRNPSKKVQRLFRAFQKHISWIVNDNLFCDSKTFHETIFLSSKDLMDAKLRTKGEKMNELSFLFKEWIAQESVRGRMNVDIKELGINTDVVISDEKLGIHAIELMRYKSGVRGSLNLARLRCYGALVSILELLRFGLADGGGIVLGHFGNPKIPELGDDLISILRRISTSKYPAFQRKDKPTIWVAVINLIEKQIAMASLQNSEWSTVDFSLPALLSHLK